MTNTRTHDSKLITKIVCVIMALAMLVPAFEWDVKAVTKHSVGQDAIDLIKETEGFQSTKYWDVSQWSIGYGSRCGENDYPNGITKAEAEKLLKSFCKSFGDAVNKFAVNNNIELTQNQFDALVCMTYALGEGLWTGYYDDSSVKGGFALKRYLLEGSEKFSFLQIARAFGEWRKAGGEVVQGLVKRRKLEIQLFLKNRTEKGCEVYRVDAPSGVNLRAKPDVSSTKTGFMVYNYIFGISEKATDSKGALWGKVHYEEKDQWVALDYCDYYVGGPVNIDGKEQTEITPSTPASGTTGYEEWKITSTDGVRLRSGPGLSYGQIGLLTNGTTVKVTETKKSDGYTWGKTSYNGLSGWCALDYAVLIGENKLDAVTISSIYIASKPTKTTYNEGEKLDLTGLKVKALYSDNSEKELAEDAYTVSGFESKEGKQTVKVTYMKKTANFTVTVKAKKLEKIMVEEQPVKKMYKTGEGLSVKGLKIKGVYSNNTTEEITKFYLDGVEGFSAAPGKKKITVLAEDQSCTFEVEVTEKALTGIAIEKLPNKTEYIVGEEFDPTGLEIYGTFDNGRKQLITDYAMMNFTLDAAGEKTITVHYNDYTVEFKINVSEPDESELKGDLDGDGERTVFDLIALNKYIDGDKTETDRTYLTDINGDKTVDQRDVDALSSIVSEQ